MSVENGRFCWIVWWSYGFFWSEFRGYGMIRIGGGGEMGLRVFVLKGVENSLFVCLWKWFSRGVGGERGEVLEY